MDSAAKNKSSCLIFLLLPVFSVVIQAWAVEDDDEGQEKAMWALDRWGSYTGVPDRSLGYGVQIPGRVITGLIPVNTFPPINVTRVLTTCHDGQTSVSIKVFEGDSSLAEQKRERECARYYAGECDVMENADLVKKYKCEDFHMLCHDLRVHYL